MVGCLESWLSELFPKDPGGAVVLLGMIAYFTGVVRAPLTAVIIVSETTASRGLILPLFTAAIIADGSARLVCKARLSNGLAKSSSGDNTPELQSLMRISYALFCLKKLKT